MRKTKTKTGNGMSRKQLLESKLLTELCSHHDYMFQELSPQRDRVTSVLKRDKRTNKTTLVGAVCIRLIVPATSTLGMKIIEMRTRKAINAKGYKKR